MLAATILPQPYLHLISDRPYHMALAHLIQAEGFEAYTEFYKGIGQDPDKFLLMDTGLIEGNARPVDELVLKAKYINASEMVLNDVFMNKDETLRESHDALEYVEQNHPEIRKMVVPQGQDFDEWVECAKEMVTWPIDTIGIPKILTNLAGRDARLHALRALQDRLGDKQIHLLGCWESPLELKIIENQIRDKKIAPVRGVDSAISYVYARSGLSITEAERPEGAIDFKHGMADLEMLKYNIHVWETEAKQLPAIQEVKNQKIHRLY